MHYNAIQRRSVLSFVVNAPKLTNFVFRFGDRAYETRRSEVKVLLVVKDILME